MKITNKSVIFSEKDAPVCILLACILMFAVAWYVESYVPTKIEIAVRQMERCVEFENHINIHPWLDGQLIAQDKIEQECKDIHPIKYTN